MTLKLRFFTPAVALALVVIGPAVSPAGADDQACLECHGSAQQVKDAAEAMGVTLDPGRAERLVVAPLKGSVHEGLGCVGCHPKAEEIPHPAGMLASNPCVDCHADALAAVNKSVHGDPKGGSAMNAPCWACHTAHRTRPVKDPEASVSPSHLAERCLQCHDKQEYLTSRHGIGVQYAGLDISATCVSCHGGHDILSHTAANSRVARRNISFTCGKCHGRVAETYRKSVHGAALTEQDNPDVPTCVDCHTAHANVDPRSTRFRLRSPEMCGRCHDNPAVMSKYGIPTRVYDTYVADFHGTTAELFRSTSPDQPMNKAVCYDCHGYHDVESIRQLGDAQIKKRLLVKCQACHPTATTAFLSAWTSHYEPSPNKYPWIYYTKLFYRLIIPGTVGFFLAYIALDVWGRRRHRRSA